MGAAILTRRTLSHGRLALGAHPSTIAHFQSRRTASSQNNPQNNNNNSQQLPSANFKDLGATRTVKIIVISFLSVIATLETITWTKLLWAKFGPPSASEAESDSETNNWAKNEMDSAMTMWRGWSIEAWALICWRICGHTVEGMKTPTPCFVPEGREVCFGCRMPSRDIVAEDLSKGLLCLLLYNYTHSSLVSRN